LKEIKDNADGDVIPFATSSADLAPFWMWWTLYSQLGGKLLSDDGKEVAFDNKESLQALQYMYDLVFEHEVWPRNIQSATDMFVSNTAAVHLNGVWATGFMEKSDGLDFGVMPLPQLYDEPKVWGDSHLLIVPKKKDKDKMVAAT